MEKYEGKNHSKCHLRYHLIIVTKYRRPCLREIKNELTKCFEGIASRRWFMVLFIGYGDDPVHLFLRSSPSISVTEIVRRIKQISTVEMWRGHGDMLSRFYLGSRRGKLWSGGYFCMTVDDASEKTVIEYIKKQG